MEVFGYSQDFTITGFALGGDMAVTNIFFNAKKYFRPDSIVQPYLGAGIGAASTTFSSAVLNGSAGGFAIQGIAGIAFRWQKIGTYTEFKYVHAEVDGTDADTGASVPVDLSGTGLFAGVSVYF
jgi:hypothetical protein